LMDADSEIITQIAVLEAGGDEAKSAISLLNSEQQTPRFVASILR